MFSLFKNKLKKSRTLRSVLAASSLFMAGAPAVSEAAPTLKAPPKITQTASQSESSKLLDWVEKFLPISEGDMPCAYSDKGCAAAGYGVRFDGFHSLKELDALKVTPKEGCTFSIKKRAYLFKMANANWDLPTTLSQFPEVKKVKKIKLKECDTKYPKSNDEAWAGDLILMPQKTLDAMNKCAANFYIQKALEFHPNLFRLPLPDQIVVVDVIYNYGNNKYAKKNISPKFKKAVQEGNLKEIREQCNTGSARRDCIRKTLADIPLVMLRPNITKSLLTKSVKDDAAALYSKIVGEMVFWKAINLLSEKIYSDQTTKNATQESVSKITEDLAVKKTKIPLLAIASKSYKRNSKKDL